MTQKTASIQVCIESPNTTSRKMPTSQKDHEQNLAAPEHRNESGRADEVRTSRGIRNSDSSVFDSHLSDEGVVNAMFDATVSCVRWVVHCQPVFLSCPTPSLELGYGYSGVGGREGAGI